MSSDEACKESFGLDNEEAGGPIVEKTNASSSDGPSEPSNPNKREKGMNVTGALSIAINVSMGTGWLTLPYAFWRCGLVMGAVFTFFFALTANMAKDYYIESMVRTEALTQAGVVGVSSDDADSSSADLSKQNEPCVKCSNCGFGFPTPNFVLGDRKWCVKFATFS